MLSDVESRTLTLQALNFSLLRKTLGPTDASVLLENGNQDIPFLLCAAFVQMPVTQAVQDARSFKRSIWQAWHVEQVSGIVIDFLQRPRFSKWIAQVANGPAGTNIKLQE